MNKAVTAVLYAPGTNCHEETIAAIELAGGQARLVLLRDLMDRRDRLEYYQAAVVPGGFSYGDHLGAGRIFGTSLVAQLSEQLNEFLANGKPMLGVCNGFQVLTEAGILPARTPGQRAMALIENQSARFEDRKVRLLVTDENCIWTKGLAGHVLNMPSAHGEGRPLMAQATSDHPHIVFRYVDGNDQPTMQYPENPNGAPQSVAGISDDKGLVLGLMPHPERAAFPAQYSQDGLRVFENLVAFLAS